MDIHTTTSKDTLVQHYEEYQNIQNTLMGDLEQLRLKNSLDSLVIGISKQRNETIRNVMAIIEAKNRIVMALDDWNAKPLIMEPTTSSTPIESKESHPLVLQSQRMLSDLETIWSYPTRLEKSDLDSISQYTRNDFEVRLLTPESYNKNLPSDLLQSAWEQYNQDIVSVGLAFGEWEPTHNPVEMDSTIRLDMVSHKITKISERYGSLFGTIEMLNTWQGNLMRECIVNSKKIAFRMRGMVVSSGEGANEKIKQIKILGWDAFRIFE